MTDTQKIGLLIRLAEDCHLVNPHAARQHLDDHRKLMWDNADLVMKFAQQLCDPHAKDRLGRTACSVVHAAAEVKMELAAGKFKRMMTGRYRLRYTQQAIDSYARLKEAAGGMARQIDPFWGDALLHSM